MTLHTRVSILGAWCSVAVLVYRMTLIAAEPTWTDTAWAILAVFSLYSLTCYFIEAARGALIRIIDRETSRDHL